MTFDGTYHVKVKTPMGALEGKLSIKTSGNTFSGTMETPSGTSDFSNGSIDGNQIKWQAETKTPMGAFDVSYSATIDGDSIVGKATTPMGNAPLEGTKG